jgi:hypothetical protein
LPFRARTIPVFFAVAGRIVCADMAARVGQLG